MKNFNKKTLIIGLLILIGVLAVVFTTFAQSPLTTRTLNPPTDLYAEVVDQNDVNLFWTQPAGGSTYLHWDNGINFTSFGNFLQPVEQDYVTKYDPEHIAAYDGWTITKMRFFVTTPVAEYKIIIMTGPDATEAYSQDIVVDTINQWTEITLDTPFEIDASTQLWAGLNIDMPGVGGVMGCDEGPAILGYGNLYRFNGIWYNGGLNWNLQLKIEEPTLPTFLHWDSGENKDSFGNFLQPVEYDFASKWDTEHISAYDGWTVTKMRFYLTNPLPTVKLKIWTGTEATEVYSQDVTSFNINAWTEVTLDTPVTIDASTPFWAGLNVNMPETGPVMGTDSGPAIDGYGNMYQFNNIWYSDFNLNWNIHFEVEDPNKRGVDGLLGYNIYRDDVKLNDDVWGATSYVNENMLNGTYDYHVTAVYDEGESDPSNIVEVIVNQPVIAYADSMALVDIYNNCGGREWSNNTLWLEGPVSEWYGVTTVGTRVTKLWLHSRGVTGDIPASVGDLTALKQLYLESNNGLNSIPEEIGQCQALEELWLGWTSITVIPESLGSLSNLTQLHLGLMIYPLGTLPESLCELESIEWLALGGSGLDSLPKNFGRLSTVESCFLWGNNLTELPDGFGGMESLNYLTLDENQLTTLPDSFGDLENLSTLRIEQNQLTHFPESFGDLASLDSLWIRWNEITHLPESFGNLSDLNFLRMSANNLTELPASFTNLATIDEVFLDNNMLEYLPEDIGNLSTLVYLYIGSNSIPTLPESISDLNNLWLLTADNNQITNIPVNIGNVGNLGVLSLSANNISTVPESIGSLSSLGFLSLAINNISTLPASIGNLEADTVFLSTNHIKELPSSMFDKYYEFLWVFENELQFGSIEPLIGHASRDFAYDPQGLIGTDTTLIAAPGQTVNYTIEVSGDNNLYWWYKDGTIINDQNTNTLTLQNVDDDDAALYQLKVTNTVAGALTLESYDMTLLVEECTPWEVLITAQVHTISIPASANPNIDGESLQTGDWVGVFYMDDNEMEVCGGAATLNAFGSAAIMAYGDDPFTPEKDGFADGEQFRWKMYKCNLQTGYDASATYDQEMPNQEFFVDLGSSKLTSLVNGYCQSFEMTAGWNSASSYVVADDPSVVVIMAPVVNNLILMRNLSQMYWPEEEVNTIGNWDNSTGYAMKFYNDADFDICGSALANKTIDVAAGWSYLPVPSECDVDALALFAAHQDDIIFAQDLIGTNVYWPELGIYTLDVLYSGKSYKIKTSNGFSLTFPDCGMDHQTSFASRKNHLNTPWGDFNMTPSSESVVVFAEALSGLETGDIIAAFNQNNVACGMMAIDNTNKNQSLILFGDDPTTIEADGFIEGEIVNYKLYRSRTGEEFTLNVEYKASMNNSTGQYFADSFAGITNMTTGITAIGEMNANNVQIYPNPARDMVSIEFASGSNNSATVSIFNAQGRIVMEEIITQGNSILNVSNLQKGIYIVRLSAASLNKTVKLVIE